MARRAGDFLSNGVMSVARIGHRKRGRMHRVWFTMMAAAFLTVIAVLVTKPPSESAYLKWNYDYVHDVPCTDARPKSCVRGFNVYVGDANSDPKPTFVANRLDEKGQPVTKSIDAKVKLQTYGSVQFCVTAVGVNATGTSVESRPICVRKFVIPFVAQDVRIDSR